MSLAGPVLMFGTIIGLLGGLVVGAYYLIRDSVEELVGERVMQLETQRYNQMDREITIEHQFKNLVFLPEEIKANVERTLDFNYDEVGHLLPFKNKGKNISYNGYWRDYTHIQGFYISDKLLLQLQKNAHDEERLYEEAAKLVAVDVPRGEIESLSLERWQGALKKAASYEEFAMVFQEREKLYDRLFARLRNLRQQVKEGSTPDLQQQFLEMYFPSMEEYEIYFKASLEKQQDYFKKLYGIMEAQPVEQPELTEKDALIE